MSDQRKSLRERANTLMERYAPHMAPRPYDELLEDIIDELRLAVAEASIHADDGRRDAMRAINDLASARLRNPADLTPNTEHDLLEIVRLSGEQP